MNSAKQHLSYALRLLVTGIPLFFFINPVFAQILIHGRVADGKGAALGGATISIKGSAKATASDSLGRFAITVLPGEMLQVSYIGYRTAEVSPGDKTELSVVLVETVKSLDDVVFLGYGSSRRKEITGSVAIVNTKDLVAVPAGQVEQMLQGRVAGLNVITSGMPGSSSNVWLHGVGNFGNVTPLYIIDGVQGDINLVNPNDIESLQVLKDAGAYSIYGVRGANGVIIVTTRSGKTGRTRVNYDFYVGNTRPAKGPDLLNPQEQADLAWLAYRNAGEVDPSTGNPYDPFYGNGKDPVLPDILVAGFFTGLSKNDPLADPALYNINPTTGPIYQIVASNKTGTDWYHELFKPAWSQNHNLSVSGGNEKNKYLFSMSYLDQQGTLLNTYLKRFTTRINTTFTVYDHVRVGENLQLSYRDNPQIINQVYNNEIWNTYKAWPVMPVYDIKGGWGTLQNGFVTFDNPVASREIAKNNSNYFWDILGNAFAEADFLKHFTIRTSFGGSFQSNYAYAYSFSSYWLSSSNLPNNAVSENSGYGRSWTWTNTLTYSKTFAQDHKLKILAGTESIDNFSRELNASRSGFFSNDINYLLLSNGSPLNQTNSETKATSSLFSLIGRLDYGFRDKLFFSATVRRDGSSVFSQESRYGWFPSFAAAWRITEEPFLHSSSWLTDLKLRASWGKTGFYGNTDPLNQYTLYGSSVFNSYYDLNGTSNSPLLGIVNTRLGNPSTTWQQDIVTNIGFESIFWQGKLSITADWYRKESAGLLFPLSLPAVVGAATPPNVNVGNVLNTGIDLLIGSQGNFSKNSSWNATVTFTTYHNEIVHLNDIPYFDLAGVRNAVGHPIGSFFGYKIIGFFNSGEDVIKSPVQQDAAPGRFKYLDADHNNVINDSDRVFYGNPNPKYTLGLNLGFIYRQFDFSTFFYGSFGNDVFNVTRQETDFYPAFPGQTNGAKSKTALYNSWTPDHQQAVAPIVEDNYNFSNLGAQNSYSLEKGTYFRNKSMILGYTLKSSTLSRLKIERLRFYVQAVNLFTITQYSGLDPELSGTTQSWGLDLGNYPNNQRQFLLGLNVAF